ncbi:hypothetical protein [Kitasatospora sp. NPDC094015]|uniref:hypothetical protein n=1 Tax=Kitasatospora sp. NPDC094015 TaxID=3155205 RepID=UPI0033323D8A
MSAERTAEGGGDRTEGDSGESAATAHAGARVRHAAERLRTGGSRVRQQATGLTDTATAAVGPHPEGSARELVLEVARYGGPVLAVVGGAALGTATAVALTRRRR